MSSNDLKKAWFRKLNWIHIQILGCLRIQIKRMRILNTGIPQYCGSGPRCRDFMYKNKSCFFYIFRFVLILIFFLSFKRRNFINTVVSTMSQLCPLSPRTRSRSTHRLCAWSTPSWLAAMSWTVGLFAWSSWHHRYFFIPVKDWLIDWLWSKLHRLFLSLNSEYFFIWR